MSIAKLTMFAVLFILAQIQILLVAAASQDTDVCAEKKAEKMSTDGRVLLQQKAKAQDMDGVQKAVERLRLPSPLSVSLEAQDFLNFTEPKAPFQYVEGQAIKVQLVNWKESYITEFAVQAACNADSTCVGYVKNSNWGPGFKILKTKEWPGSVSLKDFRAGDRNSNVLSVKYKKGATATPAYYQRFQEAYCSNAEITQRLGAWTSGTISAATQACDKIPLCRGFHYHPGSLSYVLVQWVEGAALNTNPPNECFRKDVSNCNKGGVPVLRKVVEAPGDEGSCRQGRADIAAHDEQSTFLKEDGIVWAAGDNKNKQFGSDAQPTRSVVPVRTNINGVEKIFAGYANTYFLKTDGTLWGVGSNACGRLMDDQAQPYYSTPVQIAQGVKSAAAGNLFVLIIKEDGTVWGRGDCQEGMLGLGGHGETKCCYQWTQMLKVTNAKKIIVGSQYGEYSLVLQGDGTVWATGENYKGPLCKSYVEEWENVYTPVQVLSGVKDIFAGADRTTFFFKSDDSLWGCGDNRYGQLAVGSKSDAHYMPVRITTIQNVWNIVGGAEHTIFLTNDKSAWLAGNGREGALGHGSEDDSPTPTKLPVEGVLTAAGGKYFSLFLDENCNVWGTGENRYGAILDADTFSGDWPPHDDEFRVTPKKVWTLA